MTAAGGPLISIVVSARDASGTISRCVEALVGQRGAPPFEVVVVDNASLDDTGALAAAAGARVLRLDDRAAGPGAARNHGVAAARGELIAFTDADCFPEPGWLAAIAAGFEEADLVSGPILPDSSGPRTHWDRTIAVPGASPLFATANLAVRRRDFLEVGGFQDWVTHPDEAPAHPYGEDTVLAWKLVRAGARRQFAEEAVVQHAVSKESAWRWIQRHREMENLPELVGMVPELRSELLVAGVFASKRTLASSSALGALALALVSGRRWPLIGALPAIWLNARRMRAMGGRAGAIWAAADAVSSLSLLSGSIRARRLLL